MYVPIIIKFDTTFYICIHYDGAQTAGAQTAGAQMSSRPNSGAQTAAPRSHLPVSSLSRVVSVNLRPSSNTNSNPSELHALLDSSATSQKLAFVRVIVAYFVLLAAAARFAASPAPLIVVARCDVANVSETVTSQVRHDHRISVTPSGCLPSSLMRPSGPFLEGMFALLSDLHTIPLSMLCRCSLPAFCLQARPW